MKNSLIYLVAKLLSYHKIHFDKNELSFQIQSHPSYPSLHSITGVLDHFNIENIAAQVPVEMEILAQLPDCFIAQIKTGEGMGLVLVEKKEQNFLIHKESKRTEKVSESAFLEMFTGIILAVEKSEEEKRSSFENKGILKNSVLGISILLAGFLFLSVKPTLITGLYFLLSIIGVLISIAILKQELGIQSTIGDAFCSSNSEKKDCDAVLSSKGAMIGKGLKLSDASLIYFLGLTLATFLLFIRKSDPGILFFISAFAFPVVLYSVYYQYFVVKKWCFLCLSIAAVLVIQAGMLLFIENPVFFSSLNSLLLTGLSFAVVVSSWVFIKPGYVEMLEGRKTKLAYHKFKRNYTLFSKLLKGSPKISTTIPNISEIIFGNEASNLEIVIVTNPFCGHCKPVHTIIEEILKQYPQQVKIIIRFNVDTENKEHDIFKITSTLLKIYLQKEKETCLLAMNEIYNKLSPEKWLAKWEDSNPDDRTCIEALKMQKEWCGEHKINFTPEILVNGYSYPKEYERADLTYFIEELHEEYSVSQETQETV